MPVRVDLPSNRRRLPIDTAFSEKWFPTPEGEHINVVEYSVLPGDYGAYAVVKMPRSLYNDLVQRTESFPKVNTKRATDPITPVLRTNARKNAWMYHLFDTPDQLPDGWKYCDRSHRQFHKFMRKTDSNGMTVGLQNSEVADAHGSNGEIFNGTAYKLYCHTSDTGEKTFSTRKPNRDKKSTIGNWINNVAKHLGSKFTAGPTSTGPDGTFRAGATSRSEATGSAPTTTAVLIQGTVGTGVQSLRMEDHEMRGLFRDGWHTDQYLTGCGGWVVDIPLCSKDDYENSEFEVGYPHVCKHTVTDMQTIENCKGSVVLCNLLNKCLTSEPTCDKCDKPGELFQCETCVVEEDSRPVRFCKACVTSNEPLYYMKIVKRIKLGTDSDKDSPVEVLFFRNTTPHNVREGRDPGIMGAVAHLERIPNVKSL